ncbi:DUF6708 domain-containing protein [Pseudomonas cannabina]|uniref:DUF6708 domain-containing protein n=3 Tax=Pseudomonas syringae group TaxID=136849 RepID=A0A3M3QHD0_PSECA|nr:DUF6708 domain-containing protein [Pseudomonas syringae group genomosp. 3]KPB73017.1 Uncharacterized protein AC507_0775 [Pseudomonas syringae pv. maculicola]KPW26381.1 Uncharacterized protein ALO83_00019 [Pseudomonas cannabina pv. alisalensis]RMN83647.1 hypothetical protein ALQ53_01413 [Pseudomonas cannabina]RMN78415.1 hypothetical protein ALQ52_00949 [Pseudomonas cannabina pv. alisalensis]RMN94378.1 hypothetical protein ALQ51_02717 [Pseudomonas cannabina]
MSINKYDRLPRAGDTEDESGTKVFYLAPQPLPTGIAASSSHIVNKKTADIYLDFAPTSASLEFAVRCYTASVASIIMMFLFTGVGTGVAEYFLYNTPILETAIPFLFPNWALWLFVSLLASMYGYFFFQAVYQISGTPPIRFNRQRREVAYVAKRGQPPRFIPWEEVIACVSSSIVPTEYGSQQKFALMIGLVDASDGQVMWLTVPAFTLGMAVSEWEAIRAYMEEGPDALPKPMMGDTPEQGTVGFFHMCRRDYLLDHGYLRYFFGFFLIQFCSGWTLPCHIATWVERLPKTAFPKSVQNWSKPLPRDQWQPPSAELIAQSEEVCKSFRKGMDIFEHFREKENNPSKTGD